MKWNVTNALSRDVERQHLNKILAEIRAAVEAVEFESSKPTDDVRSIVGSMVEGNVEEGVSVTYNPAAGVLDFAVNDFIISLTGDVTGQATITGLNSTSIVTSIDPDLLGIPEAPQDNEAYWRRNADWERVPYGLYELANVEGAGFIVHNDDEEGEPWFVRQMEVKAGELTLDNPDAIAGNPLFGLADLANTGVGTSPVQLFTRDAKGRVEGTEDASTDDLPEGTSNLYFTNARADARIELQKGQPLGLATLDTNSKLDAGQLPALAITDTFVVNTEAAMLALDAQQGDVAVRTDLNKSFILTADPASTLSNWQELLVPTGGVTSFNGRTGSVVPATGDYTAAQVGAATAAQGATADSAVQPGDLATVATSGAYSDLSGLPTLGTAAAANVSDFDAYGSTATNSQSGATYTYLASDRGKAVSKTGMAVTSAYTLNANVFAAGDWVRGYNLTGTQNITITPGAGMTLQLVGPGSTGMRTIGPRGSYYLFFLSPTTAVIEGTNIT